MAVTGQGQVLSRGTVGSHVCCKQKLLNAWSCLTVTAKVWETEFEMTGGYYCGCEVRDFCAKVRARFGATRYGVM